MSLKIFSNLRWIIYVVFFLISILLITFFTRNTVLCSIGCSVLASVCLAILIDMADIIKKKRLVGIQRKFLLKEYQCSIEELPWEIVENFRYIKSTVEFDGISSIMDWITIMLDKNTYASELVNASGCTDYEEAFLWISTFISRIEKAAAYFCDEQITFLISGLLSEDDIRFYKHQRSLCRSIQRYCARRDSDRTIRQIMTLIKSHDSFFGEQVLGGEYRLDNEY